MCITEFLLMNDKSLSANLISYCLIIIISGQDEKYLKYLKRFLLQPYFDTNYSRSYLVIMCRHIERYVFISNICRFFIKYFIVTHLGKAIIGSQKNDLVHISLKHCIIFIHFSVVLLSSFIICSICN